MTPKTRPSLYSIMQHSSLMERYSLSDECTVKIQPWTPEIIDEIQPVIKELLAEFRNIFNNYRTEIKNEKTDDTTYFDIILKFVENNADKLTKYVQDIVHIVYVTLHRSNRKIKIGQEEFDFFEEEEFAKDIFLSTIFDMARIIYDQNFTKNLSRVSVKVTIPAMPQAQKMTMMATKTE